MLAPSIHRFTQADLTVCGWVVNRLTQNYPMRNEIGWANYVRGMCDRNDCLFIAGDRVVALAETALLDTLANRWAVRELFVWCEDRQNHLQVERAAALYDEIHRWAKSKSIAEIVIGKNTDVPMEMISGRLGKIYKAESRWAKV